MQIVNFSFEKLKGVTLSIAKRALCIAYLYIYILELGSVHFCQNYFFFRGNNSLKAVLIERRTSLNPSNSFNPEVFAHFCH